MIARKFKNQARVNHGEAWNGRSRFRTELFNVCSLMFPLGERWIIDSVRKSFDLLEGAQKTRWKPIVDEFTRQESSHSHVHKQLNAIAITPNQTDLISARITRRIRWGEGESVESQLASSVAYEHLTYLLSSWMLKERAVWLADSDPDVRKLFIWHCAEEMEHRNVVLGLYRALGFSEWRRIAWWFRAAPTSFLDVYIQLAINLHQRRSWLKWDTWRWLAALHFGRHGIMPTLVRGTLAFCLPRYTPPRTSLDDYVRSWLEEHTGQGDIAPIDSAKDSGSPVVPWPLPSRAEG